LNVFILLNSSYIPANSLLQWKTIKFPWQNNVHKGGIIVAVKSYYSKCLPYISTQESFTNSIIYLSIYLHHHHHHHHHHLAINHIKFVGKCQPPGGNSRRRKMEDLLWRLSLELKILKFNCDSVILVCDAMVLIWFEYVSQGCIC
jgi:hypothetical protein